MVEQSDLKDNRGEEVLKQKERKSYVKPHLIEYGDVEKLTESGGGSKRDLLGQPSRV